MINEKLLNKNFLGEKYSDQNFFVRLFIFPINQKLNTLVNSLSNDQ